MARWIVACAVLLTGCSGNGSPVTPGASTITLAGTVTATNGGQPLAGAHIDTGGRSAVTNESGRFTLPEAPTGRYALMISGAGLIPHVLTIDAQTATPLTLDAIAEASGFDLAFYRQFVRNGFEHAEALEPLRRWTTAPSFDIQTVDDTGAPVDPALRASVQAAIAATVPLLTGGRFNASFGSGVPVRFIAGAGTFCGRAPIGPIGAWIELRYLSPTCTNWTRTVSHETGHVLGFWHTDQSGDLMRNGGAVTPSPRERAHAQIAYRRPVGNTDVDNDP